MSDRSYSEAVEQALKDETVFESVWLRLGHYKRRGLLRRQFRSEYRSEADGAAFFLSPNGQYDPRAELRETLIQFGQPLKMVDGLSIADAESKHAQCLFPARRKWAFRKLGWEKILRDHGAPILECKHRSEWKKQLDAEGVSLVFAAAYLNNAASMFGHTFLKFHSMANKGGKDLLDYGVNFAAETGTSSEGGVPYALYGLLGFYPGRFTMQPFHETLRTYANIEGRDLFEYRIRFSLEELDFFIDHLFELERTHFDYYFLTENCSYFLLAALEVAKPDIELSEQFWYQVIPADSVRVAARTKDFIENTKFRPSLVTFLRAHADRLSLTDVRVARDLIHTGTTGAADGLISVSTAVLDLALDYGAVRATTDPGMDKLNHQLRIERAKRGGASPPIGIQTPRRPEEGHDPARVGLLFEMPVDRGNARGRLGLQFRFAYHDRLSNDDGYLPGTTLEALKLTAWMGDQDLAQETEQIRIRDITVLEILSAQPRDVFSRPSSWRASFGFREPYYSRSLGPFISGGRGSTIQFTKHLWVTGFVDGEVLANAEIENRAAAYLGPRLVATAFLSNKTKLGVDYALMRAITPARHFDKLIIELAWAPLRNLEFRIGYNDATLEGARRSEWSLKLFQHLLF